MKLTRLKSRRNRLIFNDLGITFLFFAKERPGGEGEVKAMLTLH
jgi:hypothetical protein